MTARVSGSKADPDSTAPLLGIHRSFTCHRRRLSRAGGSWQGGRGMSVFEESTLTASGAVRGAQAAEPWTLLSCQQAKQSFPEVKFLLQRLCGEAFWGGKRKPAAPA